MPLTTQTADNADGTGFTMTVAGSGGAAVQVWYTPADRPWPGDDWILGGSRVGDGAVVVAAPQRFYFAYASTSTLASPPDRFAVTTGQDEPATLIQNGLAALIATLNLPGQTDYIEKRSFGDPSFTGVFLVNQILEDATERKHPCVSIALDGMIEREEKGTNTLDDIVYPYRVMLLDTASNNARQWHRPWVQFCRSKISKALRNHHTLGVPSLVIVRVKYNRISEKRFEAEAGSRGKTTFAGGFTIECTNREPRGLGA